jgi:hypothetical protein
MDLMIRLRPDGFRVRMGNMENWPHPPSGDVVAIFPRMGLYADAVVDALCRDSAVVDHRAPFSTVLAAVARGIAEGEATAEGGATEGDDESGTLCSHCRREREAAAESGTTEGDDESGTICSHCRREREAAAEGSTTEGDDESGTLCSHCRREREISPPPPPAPIDPSTPRLTVEALARHTRTAGSRSRTRSPRGPAPLSPKASR